jgi:hypothetical protein
VLDRDYKEPNYATRGIEAVKVTMAHEFQHIIQFASYRFAYHQTSIYEATAVWFERQVHPSIPDYRQYVDAFLMKPQRYAFSTNNVSDGITGYGHDLFMDYVATKYGRDIVRRFWELFRDRDSFKAIDDALREKETNLENSYCEFARWSYFTGYRAQEDLYLKEAAIYPAMQAEQTVPLNENTVMVGSLQPLAFSLMQVTIPTGNPNIHDTVGFLTTNSRTDIGGGGTHLASESFSIEVSPTEQTGFTPFRLDDSRTIYYRLQSEGPNLCLDAIGEQINTAIAASTSPQPFINDGGNRLLVAVGDVSQEVKTAVLNIYSTAMIPIATVNQEGLLGQNNQLGVLWDGRSSSGEAVPSGIYIYELSINGGDPVLGKFAVVRK